MKKLLLLFCICCSLSVFSQIEDYAGIGYAPRFVISSPIMDMLHAYENGFDTVIIPFKEVKIIHGGSLYGSYGFNKFNMGFGLTISYAGYYGEAKLLSEPKSITDLSLYYFSFVYDVNYVVLNGKEFHAGPGVGFDLQTELISGKLTNTAGYSSFSGEVTSNINPGFYFYVLLLTDLGDYTISLRPTYYYMLKNDTYDGLYDALIVDDVDNTFPGHTTYFGLDLYLNRW